MLFPSIIMWLAFGISSAYIAKKQSRNPFVWFFLGTFFGIFSLLFLYFTSRSTTGSTSSKKGQTGPTTIDITPNINPEHKEKLWYYLDPHNAQNGPMSFDALINAFTTGKVSKKTYVWNETLDAWKPFEDFLPNT